jgi:ApaG protein
MSDTITEGIRVQVRAEYFEPRSDPRHSRFVFTYRVRIINEGTVPAQLLSRHWVITDAMGREEQVRGDGVIGRQPTIAPGTAVEYSSFCPLNTPHGTMRGSYRMVRPDGSTFDADIAPFALVRPGAMH